MRSAALRFVLVLVLAVVFVPAACARDVPPELQPDQLLRDSLALTERDAVHVVRLSGEGGSERADPSGVQLHAGDFVQFVTTDGLLHQVRFDTLALLPAARRWLVDGGRGASPPLLNRGTRWVVDFAGAPPGRYPFVLEGNGAPGSGTVDVVER